MSPFEKLFRVFQLLSLPCHVNPKVGGQAKKDPNKEEEPQPPTTKPQATISESSGAAGGIPPTQLSLPLTDITQTSPDKISPSASDPRVGWVYHLSKHELQQEVEKFGLPSEGSVDKLRKMFVSFLRNGAENLATNMNVEPPKERPESDLADLNFPAFTTAQTYTLPTYVFSPQSNQVSSKPYVNYPSNPESDMMREMLGLPPGTSFNAVRRKLAEVARPQSGGLSREEMPSVSAANNDQIYAQDTFSLPNVARVRNNAPRIAELCDLVRKWNIKFDGERDAISFLERLNELIEAYDVQPNDIVKVLPELLKDQALLWHRNNKEFWNCFEDFRKDFETQYLPLDYHLKLDEEIRRRTQGNGELVKQYVVAISTLIRRRGGFSDSERLERIYSNLRPEYKLHVKRKDFASVSGLIKAAEEYESCLREQRNFIPPPNPAQALISETAYRPRKPFTAPHGSATLNEHRADFQEDKRNSERNVNRSQRDNRWPREDGRSNSKQHFGNEKLSSKIN